MNVTEFPANSLGNSFVFLVKVKTDYTEHVVGASVPSQKSASFLLAGVPGTPSSAPTRNANSGSSVIQVDYLTVSSANGSPITSYVVEIDDGLAGNFTKLQGDALANLTLTAAKTTGVVQSRYYRVRYRARNQIGDGPLSEIAYILAADKPSTLVVSGTDASTKLSASIVATNVSITWTLPYNGGSAILEGQIVLRQSDNVTFTEETTHCRLAEDSTQFDQRTCMIPLSALRQDSPSTNVYQLPQGQSVVIKIRFRNEVGWGEFSNEYIKSGLEMQTVPHVPTTAPTRIDVTTIGSQMGFNISELTGVATGGSPILSYHIEQDVAGGGSGPWTEVVGESSDSLVLTHLLTGLTPGSMYYYRYRARNVHGWSDGYSPVRAILMASVPTAPTAATTANSGANVIISWPLPTSDGSSTILGYRVKIKRNDGIFVEDTVNCDGMGSQQATILTSRQCSIPMSKLTGDYALPQGQLVVAVVEANNVIGYSVPSAENTVGALAQVVPQAPAAAPTRSASTDTTQLVVDWVGQTQDGGAAITSYELQMDSGDGSGFVTQVDALVTTHTITGVTSG